MHAKKYNKIRMVKYNSSVTSYTFRHWSAKFRESIKTGADREQYLGWRAGLVFLCFNWLPEDGTPVPKHVSVDT
jgi:hypothetical protein